MGIVAAHGNYFSNYPPRRLRLVWTSAVISRFLLKPSEGDDLHTPIRGQKRPGPGVYPKISAIFILVHSVWLECIENAKQGCATTWCEERTELPETSLIKDGLSKLTQLLAQCTKERMKSGSVASERCWLFQMRWMTGIEFLDPSDCTCPTVAGAAILSVLSSNSK